MRILPARVLATVLDDTTYLETFKANGEWASIGGIVFEFVETPLPGDNLEGRLFASPLLANLKNYPVKNEIVSLIISSDTSINTNTNSYKYYYLPATNIWSSNHHNAGDLQKPRSATSSEKRLSASRERICQESNRWFDRD